jgi:hypothetical protein
MKEIVGGLFFAILMLIPAAFAQSSQGITILGDYTEFKKGQDIFIYGKLTQVNTDSFLILQIINPDGDLCQIQQIIPLSNGLFLTQPIPLEGRVCGLEGNYEIKIFYGDDTKSDEFKVSSSVFKEKTGAEYLDSATKLVSGKIDFVGQKTDTAMNIYTERLLAASSNTSEDTISALEAIYVDLWDEFFISDEILEIDDAIRPAIENTLAKTASLVEENKLPFDVAKDIDRKTYSAIFYYNIGNTKNAIETLNEVFILISNSDPIKLPEAPQKSFADLEESLLNLMTKTQTILSGSVKEEIGFIYARGTAPIYSEEINSLIDILSKSRYLDVVLQKNDPLYRFVSSQWESTKTSLSEKESIEELLEQKETVDKLHKAALLLRQLDKVDRFISSDSEQNSELANLLAPKWDDLRNQLTLATSVDQILNSEKEIEDMKNVIDASSRISKAIEILKEINLDNELLDDWENLLSQVEEQNSLDEILSIVSEFDKSMNELREQRNPLSILKFQYEEMKSKAELQADNKNLFTINNALKIIDTAQQMEQGNPTVSKIDRIEVLLAWASAIAPEIKNELDSYSKDAYKIRAADILQRAQSVEDLIHLSLTKNRFLPGYVDFADSIQSKIDESRALVIKNDLDAADNMVRQIFDEYQEVLAAYSEDPYGSDVGYSSDELKRIEYRKKLDALSDTVSNFYNAGFAPHSDEFSDMLNTASDYVVHGNFLGADTKIKEMNQHLRKYLVLNNDRIIFNTEYDPENGFWILQGYVDKPDMDRRERTYVTIHSMDGEKHSALQFYNTKHGEFFTQWEAPVEPGLYVIMLQYQNVKASQLVNVEEKVDRTYSSSDLERISISEDFEQLKEFVEKFGGANLSSNSDKFELVFGEITSALTDQNLETADSKLSELKRLIERYLPARSRSAVVEAVYDDDKLVLSGAVQKTLSFREDLFVDIFDQRGNHIDEISLKDTSSGQFNEIISKPFVPGMYVAQLQYHDLTVSDFFYVAG